MLEIQKKTLQKAVDLLDSLKFTYAIVDTDGNKYGTLDVNSKKKGKRKPSEFPHGEKRAYVNGYLQNMKVGDVVVMPWGKYGKLLQGSVLSWFCKTHGAGSGTSTINPSNQTIEVLRLK
jgi:hypothetical protein